MAASFFIRERRIKSSAELRCDWLIKLFGCGCACDGLQPRASKLGISAYRQPGDQNVSPLQAPPYLVTCRKCTEHIFSKFCMSRFY